MIKINPLLQTDYYKQCHYAMYPAGLTKVYSNLTPRKSRFPDIDKVVVFGFQYFIKEYLINQWQEGFFDRPWQKVKDEYLRFINATLGDGAVCVDHIKELHDLGYLPLSIKALPEGSLCPIRVPLLTITNTGNNCAWLVNFLETILSTSTWQALTSATIAFEYKKAFIEASRKTSDDNSHVQWQAHDFSMRGMSSFESACISGAAHLLSFTGSDTIPAGVFLEKYYGADVSKELVLASVPATEHSVMSCHGKEEELGTFEYLLNTYPTGILSVVSDTWSLPKVVCDLLPALKDKILHREGKLVCRPDSFWTTPADCLCGYLGYHTQMDSLSDQETYMIRVGLIEALWDLFGGTINDKGYKVLHPCIGAIYGDSITPTMAREINERLASKGFCSSNWVGGAGSFGYAFHTRDSFGLAVKATYCEIGDDIKLNIYKDPITDDGMKKSAKGLLCVVKDDSNNYSLIDECSPEQEQVGELKEVFRDGKLLVDHTLQEIRTRLSSYL